MNNCVETYILEVLTSVRSKKAHKQIREELTAHIEDLREEYEAEGVSFEEATKKAVLAMGDASEVGEQLNREHKPQMGWGILLLTLATTAFGVLMMCIPQSPERYGGSLENYITFIVLGALFFVGSCFFDYTRLKKHPLLWYLAGMLLVYLCSKFGIMVSGVKRFLSFGFINLHIPGTATVLYMISFCGFLERFRNQGWFGIIKLMVLALFPFCSLVELSCLPFAMILFTVFGVVLLRAVYRNHFSEDGRYQFWILLSTAILMFATIIIVGFGATPYRMMRLLAFMDKGASDPYGSGWMYVIINKILEASKWIGKASPLPEGDISYLMPDLNGDFALLNIIAGYGRLAGLIVVSVVLILLVKMFTVSRNVKNSFGRSLSLGCCMILAIQFVYHILMNLGCIPLLGVALPFVSNGGSQQIVNFIVMGLILSVWRQNNILETEHFAPPPKRERRIFFEGNKLVIDFSDLIDVIEVEEE